MRTIERNLSAGRSSSKKNLQVEDFTSSLSKTEILENNEDNEEAENEKRKKGMKKIEDNNLKLDDLHEHIKNIRAETEEIRRENAKMFHIYKESFIRGLTDWHKILITCQNFEKTHFYRPIILRWL